MLDFFYEGNNKVLQRRYTTIAGAIDHFKEFRNKFAKDYNATNPSNAFLKEFEMESTYNLFTKNKRGHKLTTFHNAELPGSFVLASSHYIGTMMSPKTEWQWYANSYVEDKDPNDPDFMGYLEDSYNLHKNYPENWLMGGKYNGDVTNVAFLKHLKKTIGGKIDVYTADLGLAYGSDPNNQELIQAHANLGQIMSALLTIRKGGAFITKQYTTFEPVTITIIAAVASLFDSFKIIKPLTSRPANSEIYLLGEGFRGMSPKFEKVMLDKIENWNINPIMELSDIPEKFLDQLYEQSIHFGKSQSKKINTIMYYHEKYENVKDFKKLYGKIRYDDTDNRNASIEQFNEIAEMRTMSNDNKFKLNAKKIMFR